MLRIIFPLLLSYSALAADYTAQHEITKRYRGFVLEMAKSSDAISTDLLQLGLVTSAIYDSTTLLYVLELNQLTKRDDYRELMIDVIYRRDSNLKFTNKLIDHMLKSEPRLATKLRALQGDIDALLAASPMPLASASSAP